MCEKKTVDLFCIVQTCVCGRQVEIPIHEENTDINDFDKYEVQGFCNNCDRDVRIELDIDSVTFYSPDKIAQKENDLKEAFFEGFKKSGKGYYDEEIEQAYNKWRDNRK